MSETLHKTDAPVFTMGGDGTVAECHSHIAKVADNEFRLNGKSDLYYSLSEAEHSLADTLGIGYLT